MKNKSGFDQEFECPLAGDLKVFFDHSQQILKFFFDHTEVVESKGHRIYKTKNINCTTINDPGPLSLII